MELASALAQVLAPDTAAMDAARRRWDCIAKPLGSLGLLEWAVVRLAGITGCARPALRRRGVVVMCADNGVVAEGVTQCGSDVTAVVSKNLACGDASVCKMARVANADVIPVDIGIAQEVFCPGLIVHKLARGTQNIAQKPAMTRARALEAIGFGIDLVGELKGRGYDILATGEMGIGNTTTSSAVASVLLGRRPCEVTGRGAGLSLEGLRRKVRTVERAISQNNPDPGDPVDLLAKVGGLDLAGLTGLFLGGALHRVPIIVDGFISATAALGAQRLCPTAADYMLASHISAEPAGGLMLEALGLSPLICARMCLGEGTGAVALLPLLDMALAVYDDMATFSEIRVEQYTPQL
jgi:nicotinate-nucleotide--dimethylbenzimidazole phosphoribosyltransferase